MSETTRVTVPMAPAVVRASASTPVRVTMPSVAATVAAQPVGRAGRDFDAQWQQSTDVAIAAQAAVDAEVLAAINALDDLPDLATLFEAALK